MTVNFDFESPCSACCQAGWLYRSHSWEECDACQGTGISITREGRRLMEFLTDHYGIEFKAYPKKPKPNWSKE